MRYALFSDVHANLPTLEAVLEHIAARGDVAATYHLGDLVGARAGDVIAFGHTHKSWHRVVEGIHFLNTGNVGRPKDGDWRAGYVVLDVDAGAVQVEFVRVAYDVQRATQGIHASDLPDDFADHLRTGGKG